MTKKEQRYVRNLEIRIEELERHLKFTNNQYLEYFHATFETRTAMKQAFEALEECAEIMHECMKDDPQYMAMGKRVAVVAEF